MGTAISILVAGLLCSLAALGNGNSGNAYFTDCVSAVNLSPGSPAPVCVGGTAPVLTATITVQAGSGASGITYEWYENGINSTSGGTMVASLVTTTATSTNTYTPDVATAGTRYYYCIIRHADPACTTTEIVSASAVAVTVRALPQISSITGSIACSGGNATVVVNASGAAPLEYRVGSGSFQASNSFTLTQGSYVFTVRDANGCQTTGNHTITNPAPLSGSSAITSNYNGAQVRCNGGNDGQITVTASGGTPPYTYSMNGGSFVSTSVFNGLSAAVNYSFQIRDANGCTFNIGPRSLTQPTPLALSSPTAIGGDFTLCSGDTLKMWQRFPSGGIGPYTFQWTRNNIVIGTSDTLTINNIPGNMSPDIDTSVIRALLIDANGCVLTTNREVTVAQRPNADLSYVTSQFCSNDNTVYAPIYSNTVGRWTGGTFSVPNSQQGLSLDISSTGTFNPTTSAPSPYTVRYTIPLIPDHCPAINENFNIEITRAPEATIGYAGTPFCNTLTTGAVTLTRNYNYTGGTFSGPAGLSINATTGAVNPQASTPGSYHVTFTTPLRGGCLPAPFTTADPIVISALPVISSFTYPGSPFCSNAGVALPNITATATGGTFASAAAIQLNNTTGAVMVGSPSTPGTHAITYTLDLPTDGCPAVQRNANITITALPTATFTYSPLPICPNNTSVPVSGFAGNTGGSFTASPAGLSIIAGSGTINAAGSTPGNYTVNYTLAAAGGCPQVIVPRDISIADNTPPILTIPANTTVQCAAQTLPATTGQATATDNCTPANAIVVSYTDVISNQSCANRYQIARTWTAADAYGNATSAVQTINVFDNTGPVFTSCPASTTVPDPDGIPGINLSLITATDNCGGSVTITLASEVFEGLEGKPGFCPTKVIRTFRATDACGNFTDCVQEITVSSVASCGPCQSAVPFQSINLSASPSASVSTASIERNALCCGAGGQDNCISFNVNLHPAAIGIRIQVDGIAPNAADWNVSCDPSTITNSIICLPGGLTSSVTFCQLNKASNQFTITSIPGAEVSNDFTARVGCSNPITVNGLQTSSIQFEDLTGGGAYLPYLSASGGSNSVTFTAGSGAPSQIRYRVSGNLTANDAPCGSNGLADSDTITIQVIPAISATFSVPPNICQSNLQQVTATVAPAIGTYTYTWRNSANAIVASGSPGFTPTGPDTYSLSVSETALGLGCSSATFSVPVTFDLTAPTLTVPSAPLVLVCNPSANYTVPITNWLNTAVAGDNVALASVNGLTNNFAPVAQSCGLNQTITFTARDHCGLTTTGTAVIQYVDNVAPNISCPANTRVNCATQVPAAVNNLNSFQLAGGIATDVCDATPTLQFVNDQIINQTCTNNYEILRTYRAVDDCNNQNTCVQTIQVRALSIPSFPTSTTSTVECLSQAVQPTPPTVLDACGNPIIPTMVASPDVDCEGVKNYVYTYTDGCSGASSTWTRSYIINRSTPLPNMPNNFRDTVSCHDAAMNRLGTLTLRVVTDACGLNVPAQFIGEGYADNGPGSCTATYRYRYQYRRCDQNATPITWDYLFVIIVGNPTMTAPPAQSLCFVSAGHNYTIPAATAAPGCPSVPNPTVTYTITGATTRSGTGLNASGTFNVGVSTITWTATSCGRTATATTQVTILPAPAATISGTVTSCPGSAVNIPANVSGGTGSIQVTLNPGGISASGTAPTVTIPVAPVAATTYTIASVVDANGCSGTASGSFTVNMPAAGITGTWHGAVSDDWFDCRNWAGGNLPGPGTNVVLPAALARYPIITTSSLFSVTHIAEVNHIDIANGAAIRFGAANGGLLRVNGNWTNNAGAAGLVAGNGTVIFSGAGLQTIQTTGTSQNFHNLTIQKPIGANTPATGVTLNDPVQVAGTFTLGSYGVVNSTTANPLQITNCSAAAVTGGSNDAYVNGVMNRCTNSNSTYVFPVGNGARAAGPYRPVRVQPETAAANAFTAQYFTGTPPQTDFDMLASSLIGILNNEQWLVNSSSANRASIGLPYSNPANPGSWSPVSPDGCFICNVGVVYYNGMWYTTDFPDYIGETFNAGRPEYRYWEEDGIIWSKFIPGGLPNPYFSLGFAWNRTLPVHLLDFNGRAEQKTVWLDWKVADNNEVKGFIVEHSTDGTNFKAIANIGKGPNAQYRYQHRTPAAGDNYYRLAMLGNDGTNIYSKVVRVTVGAFITSILQVQPTLVKDITQVKVISARAQHVHIFLYDMNGRLVRTEKATMVAGMNTVPVFMRGLASAMYQMTVQTDDGSRAVFKLVKE